MITKISTLSSFGNYRQFQWGTNAVFAKRNLIYGWNYSGKTTLSRFFQLLADQDNLAKFPVCKFEIELQSGVKLTQANFASNPSIKVFNRDFIQENFQQEHKAPAVFMVGGNAIHLRKRIARLSTHEVKTKAIESGLVTNQARLKKELDSIGTSHASSIATLTGEKTYNRPKLLADIDQIRASPRASLLNDSELQAKVSLLRTTQVWADISTIASPVVQLETLRSNVENINALITTHNKRRLQIHTEKNAAKIAIERHHAASFFQTESISAKEAAIASIGLDVKRAKNLLAAIAGKKSAIETLVQQQSIAAQKINETIQFLLPDNNISVAEIPGGFFEFRRDNVPASNLSDGEKTAITFAYFLASLENNGASLNQATVFIDDPISSLDSNHIYAIYALITKRLECCQQIFVSTHNSELYTLLKDAWFDARQHFANRANDASAFYTRRFLDSNQQWHSTLEDLPVLLRKYKSEYQFLFEQLTKFANSPLASLHEAYTAPNLLRKFLEAYLGFKKPCVPAWSKKLDLLFDTDIEQIEIQKFSDDASHLQSLNRALQQPDFVTNAQNTVRKVIHALKAKDSQHYTSMCKVIGVAP